MAKRVRHVAASGSLMLQGVEGEALEKTARKEVRK